MPGNLADEDVLGAWVGRRQRSKADRIPRQRTSGKGGLRFAFYGRASTEDRQDRVSSRQWQWDNATALVAGHGRIVAEYFDVGHTRELAWPDRPQAAALLAALKDPYRGFDAVVVGEYERAFYGNQFTQMAPIFQRHGIPVWLPEVDGPVDPDSVIHQTLMMWLGVQSKREVQRAKYRVIAAMSAQAREQGRHLGGRTPYGYRLADAGPHPNRADARWGRRLHRLEPDPVTAPHVRWMFAQRLAGHSVSSIARALNDNGVPCPSRIDRKSNPHRSGNGWVLRTVAAILANPRYTGRQVWNRQRSDRDAYDLPDDLDGVRRVSRWNNADDWVISNTKSHPPLVSEEDFVAAQSANAVATPQDGSIRIYLLVGLLRCQLCGRCMDSHWVHDRPGYRCRHGNTSARPAAAARIKNLYIREDHALAQINGQLHDFIGRHQIVNPLLGRDPRAVTEFLRSNNITVLGAPTGCSLRIATNSTTPTEAIRHNANGPRGG